MMEEGAVRSSLYLYSSQAPSGWRQPFLVPRTRCAESQLFNPLPWEPHTCGVAWTCWTTCVGTPDWLAVEPGLASETVSLALMAPSVGRKGVDQAHYAVLSLGYRE